MPQAAAARIKPVCAFSVISFLSEQATLDRPTDRCPSGLGSKAKPPL